MRDATGKPAHRFHLLCMAELRLRALERRLRALAVRDVERQHAHPLGDGDEAQLEPAGRTVGQQERVLHLVVRTVPHTAGQHLEHPGLFDARVALHHGVAEQLLARLLPVSRDRVVHVQVLEVAPDHLAALSKGLQNLVRDPIHRCVRALHRHVSQTWSISFTRLSSPPGVTPSTPAAIAAWPRLSPRPSPARRRTHSRCASGPGLSRRARPSRR